MAKKRNHNGVAANGAAKPAETKAAYFLSLTVRNVRCFDDEAQTLKLSDKEGRVARWTVILGQNGTGKTTILQALAALEPVSPSGPAAFGDGKTGHPPKLLRGVQVGWYWGYLPAPRSGCNICVTLTGTQLGTRVQKAEGGEISFATVSKELLRPDREPGPLELVRCYGYGASRRLSAAFLGSPRVDDSASSLFIDDAILRDPEEWLLRLDLSACKDSAIRERQEFQLSAVKRLLINVLPDIEDIRFSVSGEMHPTPTVEAKTPYGWVALRQLGHGYRTLIAWMVDFVSRLFERYPERPNPLEAPAVLLVDEIDLHMAPLWQRKLMSTLTNCFPNTQFIVTAHSPLIVQAAAEDANIALLRREGDHVVIDNDVGYIRGWDVGMLLTSDLYGLPSARPPQYDAMFERRQVLLGKSKLTEKEKRELAELNEKVFQLPYGETAHQAKMMSELKESLELLKQNQRQAL